MSKGSGVRLASVIAPPALEFKSEKRKTKSTDFSVLFMAEMERFELSRRLPDLLP